jgi:alpha-galactosidase
MSFVLDIGQLQQSFRVRLERGGDIHEVPFSAVFSGPVQVADGVFEWALRSEMETLEPMEVLWEVPCIDLQALWFPAAGRRRSLDLNGSQGFTARLTSHAPVVCMHRADGQNRLTFAWSDATLPVTLCAEVHEETASVQCVLKLFSTDVQNGVSGKPSMLRLDVRSVFYAEAIADVASWWRVHATRPPLSVPASARLPVYSTWYSFHQPLTDSEVERQCELAKDMGFQVVIVDDGWQTSNAERGYAYCGDWDVCLEKIPDMRAHVDRIHQMGLKYVLWFAVPFVGKQSKVWARFQDKLLGVREELGAGVLDVRYPDVREYLLETYLHAVTEFGLDGLKLDFVDTFSSQRVRSIQGGVSAHEGVPSLSDDASEPRRAQRDEQSVVLAVEALFAELVDRLGAVRPDLLVEFRQSYVGPGMRAFGNMFRAVDCPEDGMENRVRTLDVRLLAEHTPVHSDMVMWHFDDSEQSVALQFLQVLFAVPQVSVRLDELNSRHEKVVRHCIAFWRQHRTVLLEGQLRPYHPELLYPLVVAKTREEWLCVAYAPMVIQLPDSADGTVSRADRPNPLHERYVFVNGTFQDAMVVEIPENLTGLCGRLTVVDCVGDICLRETVVWNAGLVKLHIPSMGTAELEVDVYEESRD